MDQAKQGGKKTHLLRLWEFLKTPKNRNPLDKLKVYENTFQNTQYNDQRLRNQFKALNQKAELPKLALTTCTKKIL